MYPDVLFDDFLVHGDACEHYQKGLIHPDYGKKNSCTEFYSVTRTNTSTAVDL